MPDTDAAHEYDDRQQEIDGLAGVVTLGLSRASKDDDH